MINIIDTYSKIGEIFNDEGFQYKKWEAYINSVYKDAAHIFKDDLDADIASGKYTFEKDFLPILNAVYKNPKLEILHQSFR